MCSYPTHSPLAGMPLKVPHPLEYLFKGHHKCVAKEALGSGLLTPITGAGEQGKSSPERGRLPLQRRMASEGSRQKSYEVKRGQAERPGEDGRTFPAVRSKAWRVGRDAVHGEGEGRTFKSLVPQSWPGKCTHREEGLEGEETEPVTAQASSRLCFECFSEGHEGCTVSGSFAIKPSHCIGVYTERWEIKMG